jgi:hypothetical protein
MSNKFFRAPFYGVKTLRAGNPGRIRKKIWNDTGWLPYAASSAAGFE